MSSAIYSRLRSLFPKSVNSSSSIRRKPRGKTSNPVFEESVDSTSPIRRKPTEKTSIVVSSQGTKFEAFVEKFKKLSDIGNFRRNASCYEAAVRRLTNAQQFSAIRDIFQHQKQYPDIKKESFVVRLIILYGKAKMLDEAQNLFDEMPSLGCERTVVSFNALLAASVSSKDYDKVGKLFKELPEQLSIKPDTVSYNTMIKALCDVGSLDSAAKVMEEMENNNRMPDLVTYNTLLDAFCNKKMISDAEKLCCLMEKKNVVPNARSYNSRLRALVRDNRVSDAVELTEEMETKGVKLDTHSYNALIKGFVDAGDLEKSKRWYGLMTQNGCHPDKATFGMLIPFSCDKEDFDYAYQLCKDSLTKTRNLHRLTIKRVIDALTERKKDELATELREIGKF